MITHRPEFLIGDKLWIRHSLPKLRHGDMPLPVHGFSRQSPPPEAAHGAFHPAEEMDAIGDVADGDLLDRFVGKEAMPHVTADSTVQLADAVGSAGYFKGQHG